MEHARAAAKAGREPEPQFATLPEPELAMSEVAQVLSDEPIYDDGPEFSSEPMPAAFGACVFLGAGLLVCLVLALFL